MSSGYINLPGVGDRAWRKPVASAAFLPLSGNIIGDVVLTKDTDTLYVWNGTSWIAIATPGASIAINGLIGDITATGPGTVAATLATVNANVGTFGSASNAITFTVNGKGLVTAASSTAIQVTESQVTNLTTNLGNKANTDLSNLIATAINQDLIFNKASPTIQSKDDASSENILLTTGSASAGASGGLYLLSGAATTQTGEIYIQTSDSGSISGQLSLFTGNSGSGVSGDAYISTGNSSGSSSGAIILQTGTASTTRGKIQFIDGSEGTAGYLWASSDIAGNGNWIAPNYAPPGNYITALTGDGTATGPGSVALTLATVNSNVGSFGTASSVGSFTVNAKGLITAASNIAISITASQVSDFNTQVATTAALKANNLSDLTNAATARTNLGLVSGGAGDIWVKKAGDTMTGALTVANVTNAINSANYPLYLQSNWVEDGFLTRSSFMMNAVNANVDDKVFDFRIANISVFSLAAIGGIRSLPNGEDDYASIGNMTYSANAPNGTTDKLVVVNSNGTGARAGSFTAQYRGSSGGALNFQGLNAFANTNTTSTGNLTSTSLGGSLRNRYSISHAAALTVSEASAVSTNLTTSTSSSLVTTYQAFNVEPSLGTSGSITNFYGLRMRNQIAGIGTMTNLYGLYVEALSRATNNYAIVTNSTTPSSLGGALSLGFAATGHTAPTAKLHIAAGTAAASTAPIKLTSGALMTTAEAGAVEFLTDAYYGTITTGAARKTFAFLESPTFTGTVTSPTIVATGVIRLKGYTVATLPAGTQGDKAFVTDALAPTYLVTVVAGGAVVTEVFYNGTNWVCT